MGSFEQQLEVFNMALDSTYERLLLSIATKVFGPCTQLRRAVHLRLGYTVSESLDRDRRTH